MAGEEMAKSYRLESLLELAAVLGPRHKCPQVQREDFAALGKGLGFRVWVQDLGFSFQSLGLGFWFMV